MSLVSNFYKNKIRKDAFKTYYSGIFEDPEEKYHYIEKLLSYSLKGQDVILFAETVTKKRLTVKITILEDNIFNLQMELLETSSLIDKFVIVKDKWRYPSFRITDKKDLLKLVTNKISIDIFKNPWQIVVTDKKGNQIFRESIQEKFKGWRDTFRACPLGFKDETCKMPGVFQSILLHSDEHIYGFGESFSDLDKKGQNIVQYINDPGATHTARGYKRVPFFISTYGYGIFIKSSDKIVYEVGSQNVNNFSFLVMSTALNYYFIYGPNFKDIINDYTDITGKPYLPPKWSFGLWMSRNSYTSRKQVENIVNNIRKNGIACDVIHLDPAWLNRKNIGKRHFVNNFEFNEKNFPNPSEMIKKLKSKGFKVCLWECPYIHKYSQMFKEGLKNGYFPVDKKGKVVLFDDKTVIDFLNPKAIEWWKEKHRKVLRLGPSAFKTDFGEGAPIEAFYHEGIHGREVHNIYPFLYTKAVYEVMKEFYKYPVIWGRSAFAGSQRFPLFWGGDPLATFSGMVSMIRAGLSMALSGFPFFSHDIGGYIGQPSPELYIRWAQFGLLSSHSRCHGIGKREPWIYGKRILSIFKKFVRIRYKLIPYLYSYAYEATKSGLPIMRPMILEFQNDPCCDTLDLQYMLGREILVAPLFDNCSYKNVYLPRGEWLDFWSGELTRGGRYIRIHVPLDRIPIFIREDSIIPMGPYMNYVEEKPCEPLELNIYVKNKASFNYFDGNNVFKFICERKNNMFKLYVTPFYNKFVIVKILEKNFKKVVRIKLDVESSVKI